jgi:polyferredoxin
VNIKERLIEEALPQLLAIQFFVAIVLLVLSFIYKSFFMTYLALWLMFLGGELYVLYDLYDLKKDLRSDNLERWYTARKRLKSDKEDIEMSAVWYFIFHFIMFVVLLALASRGAPVTLTPQEAGAIFLLALTVIVFVPAALYAYADRLTRPREVRA